MSSLHTFKLILNNTKVLGQLDSTRSATQEAIWRALTSFEGDEYPSVEHFVAHVQFVFIEFSNMVNLDEMIDHLVKQTDDPELILKQTVQCASCKAYLEIKNSNYQEILKGKKS